MLEIVWQLAQDVWGDWLLPTTAVTAGLALLMFTGTYWSRESQDHVLATCAFCAILLHGVAALVMLQVPSDAADAVTPVEVVTLELRREDDIRGDQGLIEERSGPRALPTPATELPDNNPEFDDLERTDSPATAETPLPDLTTPNWEVPTQETSIDRPEIEAEPKSDWTPPSPIAHIDDQPIAANEIPTPVVETTADRTLSSSEPELPTIALERPAETTDPAAPAGMTLSPPRPPVEIASESTPPEVIPRRTELVPELTFTPAPEPTAPEPARPRNTPQVDRPVPAPIASRTNLPPEIAAPAPIAIPELEIEPVPNSPEPTPPTRPIKPTEVAIEVEIPISPERESPVASATIGQESGPEVASVDIGELIKRSRSRLADEVPTGQFWENRLAPNRMEIVEQHGGSLATEQAVASALDWLAAHQSADGRWDSDGFTSQCPEGDVCEGHAVERQSDTGLTGLALLAFLGAGHTHLGSTPHRETVRKGLSWLLRTQRPDGDLQLGGRIYCHAMATLSITEAYAMTKDDRLRSAAQRAVTWLANAQHPESGGWRYGPKQYGDTSVYGWAVLVLRSARSAELDVPPQTWDLAKRWLPLVSSGPNGGLAAYRPGYPPSHAMTAEALFCRQVLGESPAPTVAGEAADYVLSRLPDSGDYHLYYWYYGTLCLFQHGGPHWKRWNDRLTATLLSTQEQSGHRKGSWQPETPFGIDGGRIFTTACSALCLEVYYRYLPLYSSAERNPPAP